MSVRRHGGRRGPMDGPLTDNAIRADGTAVAVDLELIELVRAQYPRLVRLAAIVCRDSWDAEDAAQTALEQAWRRRASLRDHGSLAPWLDRIVVREAIRRLD